MPVLRLELEEAVIENKTKAALLQQAQLKESSDLFNYKIICKEGKCIHVNPFDMVSVSDFFRSTILTYTKDHATTLDFSYDVVFSLLLFLYKGRLDCKTPQEVFDIYHIADFLSMEFCTYACLETLEQHLNTCEFGDILEIYQFCQRQVGSAYNVSRKVISTLLHKYNIQDTCADLLDVSEELLTVVISSDDLDLVSELMLARSLINALAPPCLLLHVRVEHLHDLELAQLLKENNNLFKHGTPFGEMVHGELVKRLTRERESTRPSRQGRTLWCFKENDAPKEPLQHQFNFGGLRFLIRVFNGVLHIITNKHTSFNLYHSLQFRALEYSEPAWDQPTQGFVHSCHVLLEPLQSHIIILQIANVRETEYQP